MNYEKFWLGIWGMILVFLMTLTICITINMHDKLNKWEKAVSNGADPMAVSCALNNAETARDAEICRIVAQGRK